MSRHCMSIICIYTCIHRRGAENGAFHGAMHRRASCAHARVASRLRAKALPSGLCCRGGHVSKRDRGVFAISLRRTGGGDGRAAGRRAGRGVLLIAREIVRTNNDARLVLLQEEDGQGAAMDALLGAACSFDMGHAHPPRNTAL